MISYDIEINTNLNDVITDRGKVFEQKFRNGTTAVFIDALTNPFLHYETPSWIHPKKGVCIHARLDDMISNWMSVNRVCEHWCAPSFCNNTQNIPRETQLLIGKNDSGEFIVFLPVINDKFISLIENNDKNSILIRMFSGCDGINNCRGLSFVYAKGLKPINLVKKCVDTALKIIKNGTRRIEERRYPDVFEYLGWCSWDSMQIRVNEKGLIEKCEEFKGKNIPVKWMIIDDMWAEVRDFYNEEYSDFGSMVKLMHSSELWSFEADPKRFPNGLAECIKKINQYGISVGMWHPTTGYWHGFDEDGDAYKQLKDCLIKNESSITIPDWHFEKSYMYYKIIHDFFRKCGVDFVKIDNQSIVETHYKGIAPIPRIAKEYHDGMEASAGEHFDNCLINCMGMSIEDMWSRTVSPVSRCSSDFMPENREWFKNHILQCAYNSILQGQFYWCDWDMWWTDDEQAEKNSLMRAISGGPIYVSDKLERSRENILAPLMLSDGRILRCDRPCVPADDCITEDCSKSKKALKLVNMADEYGIMAVMNISESNCTVSVKISPLDTEIGDYEEFALYEHFSKELVILSKNESIDIELENNDDYRLYIIAPLVDGFAGIGRTDKFISPKTIKYIHNKDIVLKENGPYAYVEDKKLIFRND